MVMTSRTIVALIAVILCVSGCASGSQVPNPLTSQLRQQLMLQDVVVTSTSNASTGEDTATLASVMPKIKSKLSSSLATGLKGARPARIEVQITRLFVHQRLLSITPITVASVSVVDVGTGQSLATYSAGHQEPLGRVAMAAVTTDEFIAKGLAESITNHVLSDTAQVDRAVPNAGGALGQIL